MIKLIPTQETLWRPSPHIINIAPHGFVKYLDHLGTDETIVEAARTSTGKGFISWDPYKRCEKCGHTNVTESESWSKVQLGVNQHECPHEFKEYPRGDAGILEYLYKNQHATPSEMPVIRTLWKAPIFVFRQLHRHRAASYNEMSARYTQLPNDFYLPKAEEVKGQSKTNKQGSEGPVAFEVVKDFIGAMTAEQAVLYERYERAIADGIAPETARMNLPGSIYSLCVVQMNLRMDLHMLGLRDDSHAQGLTQQYAQAQAAFTQALFPRWYALYEEYTKYGVRLSRTEAQQLKRILKMVDDGGSDSVRGASLPDDLRALHARLTA